MIEKLTIKIKPIRFFLALLLVTGFLNAPCFASDEEGFDVPGKLKASQVLPADLISNEIFTVREEVEWFDGLNLFTVETEYGSFEIWGEPMLRVRLREFIAWNELKETSSLEVGARSAGRETLRSIDALLMAFAHPITTIKGVPEGIGRLFRQTARDIDGIAKVISRQKGEESAGSLHRQGTEDTSRVAQAAEILVGVNSSYRFWAQKVGVNPYTTNTALEEELNRVAKMDAYTGKSTDILVPDLVKGKLKIFSTVSEKITPMIGTKWSVTTN